MAGIDAGNAVAELHIKEGYINLVIAMVSFVMVLPIYRLAAYLSLDGRVEFRLDDIWKLAISVLFLAVVHEFLHAVAYRCWGKVPFGEIHFGWSWKLFAPCCRCSVPVDIRVTRRVLILPFFGTSILALLLLWMYPSLWTVILTSGGISACTRDIWVFSEMGRLNENLLVMRHPSGEEGHLIFVMPKESEAAEREKG